MSSINHLQQIKDIGEYKLMYFHRNEQSEVTNLDDIIASRFVTLTSRLSGDLTEARGFSIKSNYGTILSMQIAEFFPCCGKAVGKKLFVKKDFFDSFLADPSKKNSIPDKDMDALFVIFLNIIEEVLKGSKYSSFSFIVSKREQELFLELITKVETYKLVNQFENIRMSSRNLCLEFCRNLW